MAREKIKTILRRMLPRKISDVLIVHLGWVIWATKYNIKQLTGRDKTHCRNILRSYYSTTNPPAKNKEKIIIFMCDGKISQGGLSDRLQGLISTYKICKDANIIFCVYFVYPVSLEDYLKPNIYDWRISAADISYNSNDAIPISHEKLLQKQLVTLPYKQIHVYTSAFYTTKETFRDYFNELFKLSLGLQQQIDNYYQEIGEKYISLAFRFQNLFGDFKDGDCRSLPPEEQVILLEKCVSEIYKIKECHEDIPKVLITSDSAAFLAVAKRIPFVYTIQGQITHIDECRVHAEKAAHSKTFIDFFMLSKSAKIICMRTGSMMKAGFPRTAAWVNNVPFEYHKF
jgi:hypothetical protein